MSSETHNKTRMRSSRMRTGRSLTVLGGVSALGGVCSWGVSALGLCLFLGGCLLRGVSAPGGCLLLGGVCSWRGCLLLGVSTLGGVCSGGCLLLGDVCSWGVSAPALGGCIPACTEADPPTPLERILDTRL